MYPAWLQEAVRHIGTREIKGVRHEPKIISWWKAIKRGGIQTDEVPWCAAFVGAMLESVGLRSSRFESARSYLEWGIALDYPCVGCIVVFSRNGGGHVGFVVGRDDKGNLMVLGGNQSDEVNIRSFQLDRVVGFRWPQAVPCVDASFNVGLPIFSGIAASTSEA